MRAALFAIPSLGRSDRDSTRKASVMAQPPLRTREPRGGRPDAGAPLTCPPQFGPCETAVPPWYANQREHRMRRSRFSEEKINALLMVVESGSKVTDVCLPHGISGLTYVRWKRKYGGLDVNEARRLKSLERRIAG